MVNRVKDLASQELDGLVISRDPAVLMLRLTTYDLKSLFIPHDLRLREQLTLGRRSHLSRS